MKACPKINLGLKVLRKRPDGYHDLETLFVPCDAFHDELFIEEADRFSIDIDRCDWDPASDLTAKAFRLLEQEFGIPPVKIVLRKGIPVGAGLGGGSSDAALALRMISSLYGLGLDDSGLARRASSLGSDCAFFIYGRPMFGEGRGELLSPFDIDLSGYELKVEIPEGVHVSTKEAYSSLHTGRRGGNSTFSSLRAVLALPVSEWKDALENDFEPSVFAAHPEIAALKQRFYDEGAVYASMSGSGSSVFGLFRKELYGSALPPSLGTYSKSS